MADEKNKKQYASYFKMMSNPKTKKPKRHTLSFVQWKQASSTERELSKAGVTRNKIRRLKGK